MKRTVMITAHSGCEGTRENSLASIETGIRLGADCVEVDVRSDKDGKLWLTHDLPDDFSGLTALEDAFALIRESGIAVNCDLKEFSALLPTLKLAKACGLYRDQLIFSGSVDPALLEQIPDITRCSRVFLNSEVLAQDLMRADPPDRAGQTAFFRTNPDFVARRLHDLGAEALNAPYAYMPDELIEALRERNVELSLWTLNEADALREFLKKDLLNVTTRSVSLALGVRKQLAERK